MFSKDSQNCPTREWACTCICHIQGHQCHISIWISRKTFIYSETGEAEIQLESRRMTLNEREEVPMFQLLPWPCQEGPLLWTSPLRPALVFLWHQPSLWGNESVGTRNMLTWRQIPYPDHAHTRFQNTLSKGFLTYLRPVQASFPLSALPQMDCVPSVYPSSVTGDWVSVYWNRGRTGVFTLG